MLDAQGDNLERGRIDHVRPEDFGALVYEILERELSCEGIVLANAFKTRIIAEAQIKTDKVDARILADLLRGRLVSSVHIPGPQRSGVPEKGWNSQHRPDFC